MTAISRFRRALRGIDRLAANVDINPPLHYGTEQLPGGRSRHNMTMRMIPPPPEYAAVYRRRGLEPPTLQSNYDPASLWPYLPREPHEAYARSQGYFWLPCPLCGKGFGGHEIGEYIHLGHDEPGIKSGICPVCTADRNGGQP